MWPFVTMPTVVCRCRAALDDTGRQTSVPNMRQRETTSENSRTTLADAGATIRRRVAFCPRSCPPWGMLGRTIKRLHQGRDRRVALQSCPIVERCRNGRAHPGRPIGWSSVCRC
ncbi:hypothetical protein MRX96_045578 [Rhipicephalus microplus]